MFPQHSLPEAENMEYSQWGKESYQIAVDIAYNGIKIGEMPSNEYLEIGKFTALRQVALSSYRLARLLEEVFNNS